MSLAVKFLKAKYSLFKAKHEGKGTFIVTEIRTYPTPPPMLNLDFKEDTECLSSGVP
jgi:hypothetical protein